MAGPHLRMARFFPESIDLGDDILMGVTDAIQRSSRYLPRHHQAHSYDKDTVRPAHTSWDVVQVKTAKFSAPAIFRGHGWRDPITFISWVVSGGEICEALERLVSID